MKSGKYYNKLVLRVSMFLMIMLTFAACSDEKEPDDIIRSEQDILGYWEGADDRYIYFKDNNQAYNLYVSTQEGLVIGDWYDDGFFYEPGYNLIIYIDQTLHPTVYQVIELTEETLVWCWVKDIREEYDSSASIGQVLGDIIKEAQQGFTLDPALYQTFKRLSKDQFLDILESLNLTYPWWIDN